MKIRLVALFLIMAGLYIVYARPFGVRRGGADGSDSRKEQLVKIAIFSDSHNSNDNLHKAGEIAKDLSVDFAIHLGDYTDVGTQSELDSAKKALDGSGLAYFTVPGDHEYYISEWGRRTRGIDNYGKVFSDRYGKKIVSGPLRPIRLVFLDNASTTKGMDEKQKLWFMDQMTQAKFRGELIYVFAHNPFYHPSNPRIMGEKSKAVKRQAEEILSLMRSAPIKAVVAGDQHMFSINKDPLSDFYHIVAGSLASRRNLQTPRFILMTIFTDGSFDIKEVVL